MDYVGPLNGAEDARAREAFESWHKRMSTATRRWVVLPCRRCGDRSIPAATGLCATCDSDASWAAFNRAMCNLLHRGDGSGRAARPRPRGLDSLWAPNENANATAV